jgi:hypothetical protein
MTPVAHPLDLLFEAWARVGGVDSVDLRVRAYRALDTRAEWDRDSLCRVLARVVATDERQRRALEALLADPAVLPATRISVPLIGDWISSNSYNERPLPSAPSVAIVPSASSAPSRPRSEPAPPLESKRAPPKRSAWPWLVAVVAFVLLAVVLATPLAGPPGGQQDPPLGLPPPANAAMVSETRTRFIERYSFGLGVGAMVLLAAVVVALVWRERSRRRQPLADDDDAQGELEFPPDESQADQLRQAGSRREDFTRLGRHVPVLPIRPGQLDEVRTVQASIENGGLFMPWIGQTRVVPSIALVRATQLDWVEQRLTEELTDGLREDGVQVVALPEPDAAHVNLVLVNLKLAVHARDLTRLEAWSREPRTAMIETRDRALWGAEVETLTWPLFPLSPEGIEEALTTLDCQARLPPPRASSYSPPEARLQDAALLATACAIAEPADLECADRLRESFTPWLPLSALQRVAQLPGVTLDQRGMLFSLRLKQRLLSRASRVFHSKVLRWHIAERLEKADPKPNTLADAMKARELALAEITLAALEGGARAHARVRRALVELEAQARTPSFQRRIFERVRETLLLLPKNHRLGWAAPFALGRLQQLSHGVVPARPLSGAGGSAVLVADDKPRFAPPLLSARLFAPLVAIFGLLLGSWAPREIPEQYQTFTLSDVPPPPSGACEGGLALCGDQCVDLSSDPRHCGTCGNVCSAGGCSFGSCGASPIPPAGREPTRMPAALHSPSVAPPKPRACPAHECRQLGKCTRRGEECVAARDVDCSEICREFGTCIARNGKCTVLDSADCKRSEGCLSRGACSKHDDACAPVSDLDCAGSRLCQDSGACQLKSIGVCGPATDRDCRYSDQCEVSGACSLVDGTCQARTQDDCAASRGCSARGRCRLAKGACEVGTDDDCRRASLCGEAGKCVALDGECVAASDTDCLKSAGCATAARCSFNASTRTCVALPEDCLKSDQCRDEGRCFERDGRCVAASSADCKRSTNCKWAGHCTLNQLFSMCSAGSDADCRASERCKEFGSCWQGSGFCTARSSIDCERSTHCKQLGHCFFRSGYCEGPPASASTEPPSPEAPAPSAEDPPAPPAEEKK